MAADCIARPCAGRVLYLGTALLLCASACARPPMTDDTFTTPSLAPLAAAVAAGDAAEIRRQLETQDANARGADGATLLVDAIVRGQVASVEALLESGADPDLPGKGGETPVHAAAFARDPRLLALVLQHGGNPNVPNPETGATPLVQAILGPDPTRVAALLDAGADPDIADRLGDVPLHTAARTNAGATILLLFERGASPLAVNRRGRSFQDYYFGFPRNVLNARALQERRDIVAWLKAHGVPLEAKVEADY